eukprot:scaffold1724_cov341-Pavlova_lutheri.AAC.57
MEWQAISEGLVPRVACKRKQPFRGVGRRLLRITFGIPKRSSRCGAVRVAHAPAFPLHASRTAGHEPSTFAGWFRAIGRFRGLGMKGRQPFFPVPTLIVPSLIVEAVVGALQKHPRWVCDVSV